METIGTLKVGETVMAYNPKTHKMEAELVEHVWLNKDSDLIDLTITTVTPAHDGKPATTTSEVVHTTSEHPFLTKEQGFVPVGNLKLGMHVLRADGSYGVITGWKQVQGTRVMYNLEVQQDHTFAVGEGEWVVHNRCNSTALRSNLGIVTGAAYQAAHIIPCEFSGGGRSPHALVTLAEGGNLDYLNGAWNGTALPNSVALGARVQLPWHLGYHQNYSRQVGDILEQMWGWMQAQGYTTPLEAQAALHIIGSSIKYQLIAAGRATPGIGCNAVTLSIQG